MIMYHGMKAYDKIINLNFLDFLQDGNKKSIKKRH